MTSRRQFLSVLSGAAAAWPIGGRGEQAKMPVIGFLNAGTPENSAPSLAAFRKGIGELGYVEGQNFIVEYRWGGNQFERLPALATDLVRHNVSVIIATGHSASALAAKSATATIPIVFISPNDPVGNGLVASLNRPGGNATGVSRLTGELSAKRFELLVQVVPNASVVAMLINPDSPTAESYIKEAEIPARSLGREIRVVKANNPGEFSGAFAALPQLRAGALLIVPDTLFNIHSHELGALALRNSVPAAYTLREFVVAGGLMSYGAMIIDAYHLVGVYAGKILKGAKPADLPVQAPTKFELVINLKTAKALDLSVPLPLLALADEVIE